MGILAFFVFWYFISGRNNPRIFSKIKQYKKVLIPLACLLIFPNVSSTFLAISIVIGILGLPSMLIGKALKAIFKPVETENAKRAKEVRNSAIPKSEQLPNAVPKRIKIVQKFNDKYGLNLTSNQIQTIVDSSYFSTDWEYLILSMLKEYTTIHQWFKSPVGGWLRTYLKVFNVQNISSDMGQQKQICLSSFEQIFSSIDLSTYNTPAWDINKINNQFMTNFDDISFMIAYRFLEANGYKHNLGKVEILQTDSELSALKKKYDEESALSSPVGAR